MRRLQRIKKKKEEKIYALSCDCLLLNIKLSQFHLFYHIELKLILSSSNKNYPKVFTKQSFLKYIFDLFCSIIRIGRYRNIMNRSSSTKKSDTNCVAPYTSICVPPGTYTSAFDERRWLKSHGKEERINFSDEALTKLRRYFDSLDTEGKGSLGIEELEDPLIAFGLSENRQDVKQLIESVDQDGSGKIEFDEFLSIMMNIKRGGPATKSSSSAMFDFFKRLSSDNMGTLYNKDVSFRMNVSQERRRQMMESLMSHAKQKREKGMKILQNFKNQVLGNTQMKQQLYESKKSNIYIYGFEKDKNN